MVKVWQCEPESSISDSLRWTDIITPWLIITRGALVQIIMAPHTLNVGFQLHHNLYELIYLMLILVYLCWDFAKQKRK